MSEIAFTKVVGTGNDFIIIREDDLKSHIEHVVSLCDRRHGVGADGVLLIGTSKNADFTMRIINADGSEAQMCGNGIRCAALWARHTRLVVSDTMKIQTPAGLLDVTLTDFGPKVQMPEPNCLALDQEIKIDGKSFVYHGIHTGVPHIVIFVEEVDKQDVHTIGRVLRHHKRFQPHGTNVNFVQVLEKNRIKVRTYERGVEAETLACGTGATASSLISQMKQGISSPVEVVTSGGENLRIEFSISPDKKPHCVFMTGPVQIVYEGKINI